MAWEKLVQFILGGNFLIAQSLMPDSAMPVSAAEMRSYSCAHSVVSMVRGMNQPGPIFAEGKLVFTSISATDGSKILVVNAGQGTYAIPLEGSGVNRIRFEMPGLVGGQKQLFFLSYMHGEALRSRYFEFSSGLPPYGKDVLDYVSVTARRTPQLKDHLEYAIRETAENIVSGITEGKLQREHFSSHQVNGCDYIYQNSPKLAQTLRRRVDELEMLVSGPRVSLPAGRMPASVSWRR